MVWSSRSYQRINSWSLLVNEKKLSPPLSCCLRFSICASNHERDITAWALRNSRLDVELISLEITLVRYFSTGNSLIATILSASTTMRRVPSKVWVSLRSQWKFTPMVTSLSENEASSACGVNVRLRYWVPRHNMPPSLNSTTWLPVITSPLAM